MEKLKSSRKENLAPEYLDGQISKLLDFTQKEWKEHWMNSGFCELFPNLTFRLFSLENPNKYTEEQKQTIFKSGFTSFMELPWTSGGTATQGKIMMVDKKTQLWERTMSKQVEPGRESLVTTAIGSFILLALSLKNKERAVNLIIESYNETTKTPTKQRSFREHIMNKLITTRSVFRQWVKTNSLDLKNGFQWDNEVTRLGLRLLLQSKFPPEFKDLSNYPPQVIAEFVDYILALPLEIRYRLRSHINVFVRTDLPSRINSADFNDYPLLRDQMQQNLNELTNLIRS